MDVKDAVVERVQGQVRYVLSPKSARIREASGGTWVVEGGQLIPVAGPMQVELVGDDCFVWCASCGWKGDMRPYAQRLELNNDAAEHRCPTDPARERSGQELTRPAG